MQGQLTRFPSIQRMSLELALSLSSSLFAITLPFTYGHDTADIPILAAKGRLTLGGDDTLLLVRNSTIASYFGRPSFDDPTSNLAAPANQFNDNA